MKLLIEALFRMKVSLEVSVWLR